MTSPTSVGETRHAFSRRAVSRAVRSFGLCSYLVSVIRYPVSVTTDINTLIGPYPFRHVPHPDPEVLVRVLDREGITSAWVGHLPSAFHRDPTLGNRELAARVAPFADRLRAVPAIRPDWPRWEHAVRDAVASGAPAIRAYPPQWGLGAHDPTMRDLALAVGEQGMALVLTVRFEDLRQRHSMDTAGDLSAAAIRTL